MTQWHSWKNRGLRNPKHWMTVNNTYHSIVTLSNNNLNSYITRHRLVETILFFCLQEAELTLKDKHCLRVTGWEKKQTEPGNKRALLFYQLTKKNSKQISSEAMKGVTSYWSRDNPPRRNFNSKYVHTLNMDSSNFIKQALLNLKSQIYPNTVLLDNFSSPLSTFDRLYKKK